MLNASCLELLMQTTPCARCLSLANTGSSSAANIPIMAMTTSSSMSVKAGWRVRSAERGARNPSGDSLRRVLCRYCVLRNGTPCVVSGTGPRLPPLRKQQEITPHQQVRQHALHDVVRPLVRKVQRAGQGAHAGAGVVPADEPQPEPINQEVRRKPRHRQRTETSFHSEQTEKGDEKLSQPDQQQELAERHPNQRVGGVQGASWADGTERLGQSRDTQYHARRPHEHCLPHLSSPGFPIKTHSLKNSVTAW